MGKTSFRYCISIFSFVFGAFAFAQTTRVDVDPAFPSLGSGAPLVFSGGGFADVVLATTDPGAPLVDSIKGAPGPQRTPSASLLFSGMARTPSLDGGFTYKPPDTHFSVGTGAGAAGRVVEVTNKGIQIFDKTGASVAGPTDLDAFLTRRTRGQAEV